MSLPRAKLLRICHIPKSRVPANCHVHRITPLNLNPSARLPLTRSLASHSTADDGHHDAHESHYDPPGGWFLGVPPGEKYKKEGWEDTMFYGYVGALVFGVVLYAYKPDTSIQTWALEEARRRLEAEGILEDPSPGPKVGWDMSSYRPGGKDSSWPAEWAD